MGISRKVVVFLFGLALLLSMQGEAAGDTEFATTGRIVGTVQRAADGAPIPQGWVHVFNAQGRGVQKIEAIGGRFASSGLAPGTYLAFITNTENELGQIYGGEPACLIEGWMSFHCDTRSGKPIAVEAGQDAKIEFSLTAGAFLEGKISAPPGAMAESASIQVANHLGKLAWHENVRLPGAYRAGPLPPGRYVLDASTPEAPRQLPGGRICYSAPCFREDAAITLAPGEIRGLPDLPLAHYGQLALQVVDRRTGAGIRAELRLYSAATRERVERIRPSYGPDGKIVAELVPPGEYLVTAGASRREWRALGDIPFLAGGEAAALDGARKVVVPAGGKVELPPIRLRQLGAIRGGVVGAWNESPHGSEVLAYRHGKLARQTFVDVRGEFELTALEPGAYQVAIRGWKGQSLLLGSREPCLAQHSVKDPLPAPCDFAGGTAFEVDFEETLDTGDIVIPAGARIRGKLRLAPGIVGLPSLQVFAADHRQLLSLTAREPTNEWELDFHLPGGSTYYLAATAPGHLPQLYLHHDCPSGVPFPACAKDAQMTLLTLAPGEERDGVVFNLKIDDAAGAP